MNNQRLTQLLAELRDGSTGEIGEGFAEDVVRRLTPPQLKLPAGLILGCTSLSVIIATTIGFAIGSTHGHGQNSSSSPPPWNPTGTNALLVSR